MSTETFNLDRLAAERAQAMVNQVKLMNDINKPVETLERLSTKALGVLQEQGVYAVMLFLFSRSSDEHKVQPLIRAQLYEALRQLPGFQQAVIEDKPEKALKFYTDNVLKSLDTLLLVRDLYEQTLIYARYGAKAAGG